MNKYQEVFLYTCPMHCEGEKVYPKPGDCPVCNMHLVEVVNPDNENTVSPKTVKVEDVHHQHPKPPTLLSNKQASNQGKYYCPMHCEGDKTYDKPGDCPVCGMHLNKVEKTSSAKIIYTCPMHPEVKQDHPGDCPKCGMTLVPEKGVETSEEESAYRKMSQKFWIALALSVPVFLIAMSDFISFLHLESLVSKRTWGWVEFILATPVVFYCSWDFFVRGWSSVRRWSLNMWTLVSIGVGSAYLFSVFALLFPSIFPDQFKDKNGNVHLYFEAFMFFFFVR